MLKSATRLLSKIKKELPNVLGDNLYGVYVYGSLTSGGFRPTSSDIDCIAVINQSLSRKEIISLRKWHMRLLKKDSWAHRLELSYVTKLNVTSQIGKVIKVVRYWGTKLLEKVSDASSPITWLNILDSGVILFGPDPKEFVPEIKEKQIRDALKMEFDEINKHPKKFLAEDWSKIYVVLTLCRILYTLQTGEMKSKQVAARWCLANLPKRWRPLVASAENALSATKKWKRLTHPTHAVNEKSLPEIFAFEKYVGTQL